MGGGAILLALILAIRMLIKRRKAKRADGAGQKAKSRKAQTAGKTQSEKQKAAGKEQPGGQEAADRADGTTLQGAEK